MIEAYRFKIEGTTGSGNTWTTEGTIEGNIANPSIYLAVMSASFQQLTSGRAVFGQPGAGCRGPYTITKLVLEKATQ